MADSRIRQIEIGNKYNNESKNGLSAVTNYTDKINASDGTGAHWQVKSKTGYNKASGNIDLPSVYVNPNLSNEAKDVPYMHFGFYSGTTLGIDLGFQYIRNRGDLISMDMITPNQHQAKELLYTEHMYRGPLIIWLGE